MAAPQLTQSTPASPPPIQGAADGFHDIKPLPEFHPFPYFAVGCSIAGLIAAICLWVVIRRLKNRPVAAVPAPQLSPYERALEEIRRLELLRKDRRISLRDHGTGVSLAVRRYLDDVFRFPASDQTVFEVCATLPGALKQSLPTLSRERIAEQVAELRGRLKFFERLAFAEDSSAAFHWESPELLDSVERSLGLLRDWDQSARREAERIQSVMEAGRVPASQNQEGR